MLDNGCLGTGTDDHQIMIVRQWTVNGQFNGLFDDRAIWNIDEAAAIQQGQVHGIELTVLP